MIASSITPTNALMPNVEHYDRCTESMIHAPYYSTGQSVYKFMQITINMHNISRCSLVS